MDGGPCGLGRESTLLDMSRTPYRVLRQGALPEEEITAALAEKLTLIGLTGPSGAGKTSALREIAQQGGLVLDCDDIYHALLEQDAELLSELDAAFPGAVQEGRLDRRALAALVFSEPSALAQLNTITHRHVSAEVERRLRAWAMQGGELAAVDAIELISSGLAKRCTATVAVLADKETRISRIMARDGLTREEAERRVQAQKSDAYFIDNCDFCLYNDGEQTLFTEEFNKLLKEIQHE